MSSLEGSRNVTTSCSSKQTISPLGNTSQGSSSQDEIDSAEPLSTAATHFKRWRRLRPLVCRLLSNRKFSCWCLKLAGGVNGRQEYGRVNALLQLKVPAVISPQLQAPKPPASGWRLNFLVYSRFFYQFSPLTIQIQTVLHLN